MATDPRMSKELFFAAHVCVHCGSAFRREELEGRALTTGIYLCPKCGVEGPLNLEIREAKMLEDDAGESD